MSILRGARFTPPTQYQWVTEFHCENRDCVYESAYYCYLDNSELPVDTQFCPDCGAKLNNDFLETLYAESVQRLDFLTHEPQKQYQFIFDSLDVFRRCMNAAPHPQRLSRYRIVGLDLLLRYAPILFDKDALLLAKALVSNYELENYRATRFPMITDYLAFLQAYFLSIPAGTSLRQNDLAPDYQSKAVEFVPYAHKLSDLVYVWSNFGYVTRETIKNRVYFSRAEIIPAIR